MAKTIANILLVEDDTNLGTLLTEYLNAKGYQTHLAVNGQEGYTKFLSSKYDICLLDIMMPLKDGITLAKEIRAINSTVPIIFLTAKSMKDDTIEGFMAGADDYLTKPFSMEELLVRINAILRRTANSVNKTEIPAEFKVGEYTFHTQNFMLERKGKSQKLTSKEANLLQLLCMHKNDILDRSFALKTIWLDDSYFNSRSMDVYIAKLRKYLKDDSTIEIINIHGKGFKLLAA